MEDYEFHRWRDRRRTGKGIHPTAWVDKETHIGVDVEIGPFCVIDKGVEIGRGSKIGHYVWLRPGVVIGQRTQISGFGGDIRERAKIGDDCVIGSLCGITQDAVIGNNVIMSASFFQTNKVHKGPEKYATDIKEPGGTIGDNVLIGINVTLMPGVDIGESSVIGANTVLRESVPPGEIWYGNPAKFIKKNKDSFDLSEK